MDVSCGSIMPRRLLISLLLIILSILGLWLAMGPLRIKPWSTDYKLVGLISGDSTKSSEADILSTEEIGCAFGGRVCTLQPCTALQPVASPAKGPENLHRMKQIRLVVGDHVYMTSHSHEEVLNKWSIPHPVLDLQKLMGDEPAQDDWADCFTRSRYSPWWMTVRETLIIPADAKLSQIPTNTPGAPCPTCGVYFLDRSSMLVHMATSQR